MRKFKLIKEYPGSSKLGKILKPKVETENNNTNNYYWEGSWFNPKDYPEFWQEVVEKEYEILSFTCNNKKLYYNKNLKSFNYANNDYHTHRTLEFILKNPNTYKIHSIKRLSDGKIFTIGNKYNNKYIIKSFGLIENNKHCMVYSKESFETESNGEYNINNIFHSKQPLFTTEDGVDIFNYSEDFYWVKKESLRLCDRIVEKNYHFKFFIYEPENELYFSTKEKAEEYILMNKPCLSLKEVLEIVPFLDRSEKKLKELVQQKLNK